MKGMLGRSRYFSTTVLFLAITLLIACDTTPRDPALDDSPTYGRAVILADESLEPMLEDHLLVFNSTYTDAEVVVHFLPEGELTKTMLADSVRAVFGYFNPGGEQQTYFRTRSLAVHQEAVATDAIVAVVGVNSTIQKITVQQIKALLTGASDSTTIIFDKNGSSIPRSLVDSLFAGDVSQIKRGTAAKGTQDLIHRLQNDHKAVGFIPFSVISDMDDPRCMAIRNALRILPVAKTDTTGAFLPDQGTLKDGSYPLRRKVIMLVTEGKSGLGTGFASFIASIKGQRIILKQGMAPERTPSRDVEIVHP